MMSSLTGKAYLKHLASGSMKQIGVRMNLQVAGLDMRNLELQGRKCVEQRCGGALAHTCGGTEDPSTNSQKTTTWHI